MVNTGVHVLPLYCAPVPDVRMMIGGSAQRCGHASIKLCISVGDPRPSSSLTTSEESDSDDDDDDDDDTKVNEVSAFVVCLLLSCIDRETEKNFA